jgi:hypothetical protein
MSSALDGTRLKETHGGVGKVGEFCVLFLLLGLNAPARLTATGRGLSITSDGWTVSADGAQGIFTVVHLKLGTVMRNARLNLREGRALLTFNNWSAEGIGQNQLSMKTTKPPTVWLVKLGPNALEISSTSAEGVVTAQVPAPAERVVARPVDPEGAPVTWVGTDEVAGTYGGSETRNPSHLPRRNPDVIYFSLGQVSSRNLHSLFDRKLDVAVQFSEQTLMERDAQDPDLLEVTIPVLGHAQVSVLPDYYTKTLGVPYFVPFDDSYFRRPPMVWSS